MRLKIENTPAVPRFAHAHLKIGAANFAGKKQPQALHSGVGFSLRACAYFSLWFIFLMEKKSFKR